MATSPRVTLLFVLLLPVLVLGPADGAGARKDPLSSRAAAADQQVVVA